VPFIFLLILSACGDMTSLFPPGDNFLIRANINGMPLQGVSPLVRSGDRIYPYFAISVKDDPDITGLLIYLRNQYGEALGHSIKFVIGIPSDEVAETETEYEDEYETDVYALPETGDSVIEVAIRSFDQELPPFTLPENMEIGPHTIVFEALSRRAILRRTEIPIFYLGNAEFSIRDISMSLPGLFESRLVPPRTKVLLEARLDFDSRLDPYLIWHSGRNIISEGRAREGAGSVLWEAPSQTAFHPLRLEVIPFPPVGIRHNFVGISREILLPVSAVAESAGFFFGTGQGHPARNRLAEGIFHLDHIFTDSLEEDEIDTEYLLEGPRLYSWHQFKGRLHDTVSDRDDLAPADDENLPRWTSIGHSYGLSTGDDDAFLLSPVNFFREEQDHGGGIFLFHIRSIADGTIFSAYFPSDSSSGGAWLDMSRKLDSIVLRLGTAETTVEMPIFLSHSDMRTLIPAAVKFYIHPDRMEANLSLGENAFLQSTIQEVRLSEVLTGEGIVRLGGAPLDSWTQAPSRVVTRLANLRNMPREEPLSPPDIDEETPYLDETEDDIDILEWDDETEITLSVVMAPPMETETIDPSITTVWNEFAVMLSSLPFPVPAGDVPEDEEYTEEEALAELTDCDSVETAIALESHNNQTAATGLDFTEAETQETGLGAEYIDAGTRMEMLI